MSIKTKRLLIIYTLTALIALSGYACAAARELESLRLSTRYASARAFEEAVSAVEGMSGALRKLAYVTDESLGKSLCAMSRTSPWARASAPRPVPTPRRRRRRSRSCPSTTGSWKSWRAGWAARGTTPEVSAPWRRRGFPMSTGSICVPTARRRRISPGSFGICRHSSTTAASRWTRGKSAF